MRFSLLKFKNYSKQNYLYFLLLVTYLLLASCANAPWERNKNANEPVDKQVVLAKDDAAKNPESIPAKKSF